MLKQSNIHMVAADGLASNWYQDICNQNDDEIEWMDIRIVPS